MTNPDWTTGAYDLDELVDDCREISGVLAPSLVDLTRLPRPRATPTPPISADTAALVDGLGSYGS